MIEHSGQARPGISLESASSDATYSSPQRARMERAPANVPLTCCATRLLADPDPPRRFPIAFRLLCPSWKSWQQRESCCAVPAAALRPGGRREPVPRQRRKGAAPRCRAQGHERPLVVRRQPWLGFVRQTQPRQERHPCWPWCRLQGCFRSLQWIRPGGGPPPRLHELTDVHHVVLDVPGEGPAVQHSLEVRLPCGSHNILFAFALC